MEKHLPLLKIKRTHWILRAYIAAARNERLEPRDFVYGLEESNSDALAALAYQPVASSEKHWTENVKIAKLVYQLYGYTAREQFAKGIVEQPGRIENLIICADLRRIYGDLSDVSGFNRKGNLILERHNNILIPERDGKWIVKLTGHSSHQLAKQLQAA